jgi:hypothetical protein
MNRLWQRRAAAMNGLREFWHGPLLGPAPVYDQSARHVFTDNIVRVRRTAVAHSDHRAAGNPNCAELERRERHPFDQ